MKQANIIASVILAGAVLLAAYAIGRLIRQARTGDTVATPAPVGEMIDINDVNAPDAVEASRRINYRRKELTPEERARIREEREAKIAEMENLTEEEKAQLLDETRRRLRPRPPRGQRGPGRIPRLTPEELADASKRWPQMTEAERAAFRSRMEGMRRLPAEMRRPETLETKTSAAQPADSSVAEANAPDPNAADPNQ